MTMKTYNSSLRKLRTALAILCAISTSYIATFLYERSFFSKVLDFLPNIYFFGMVLTGIIILFIFFKKPIVLYLFTYPNLGRITYSINVRSVFKNTVFKYPCTASQLKSNILSYMNNANSIDVLMISGASRIKDPLQKLVLDELEKVIRDRDTVKVRIFLLDPNSFYVQKRAHELHTNNSEKVKQYIDRHKENINNIINLYGRNRIVFYDEMPIWRIYRIGNIMYVARYTDKRPASESVTIGYLRPEQADKQQTNNQYISFQKYFDYLSEKFEKGSDKLSKYVYDQLLNDIESGKTNGNSCFCCACRKDITNLITSRLKNENINIERARSTNKLYEIYTQSREVVFNNKHCELIMN